MLAYGELVKLALFCANQARTTTEKEVRSRAWRLALQYREDAAKLGKSPDIGEAPYAGDDVIAPYRCKYMNKLPMTAAGHLALGNELTRRIRAERPRLIQRIQEAIADDTNLAENSDYQAVKTEQELNEARIGELEDKRAEIINVAKLSGDTIKFGATVTLIEEEPRRSVWI